MRESVLKNFLVNLRAFFMVNLRKKANQNSAEIAELKLRVAELETGYKRLANHSLYLSVLDYYSKHPDLAIPYAKELDYLKDKGEYCTFPYKDATNVTQVVADIDNKVGLPYVIHKGKRLYFPETFSVDDAAYHYQYLVNTEQLLGKEEKTEAPHQYQSGNICVDDGDVVYDIGSAEGLFALDNIDHASRVILVECDEKWQECLRHTFAPYGNKVEIVGKMLTCQDTEQTISLKTLLHDNDTAAAFVKMDIEGAERIIITQAADFLTSSHRALKLSLATYHKQDDSTILKQAFDELGFLSDFSKGYMLFQLYDTPVPPYFRKGVIRAKNF